MGRLLLTVVLGLGIFGLVVWYFEVPLPHPFVEDVKPVSDKTPKEIKHEELGGLLYTGPELPPLPSVEGSFIDPIIVNGHLTVIEKIEVSSQVDEELLFIGEEVPDGTIAVGGAAAFVSEPFHFAKVDRAGQDLLKFYCQIKESGSVRPDQMIGMLNPSKVLNELAAKRAKINMAKAEFDVSRATYNEAASRLETKERLYRTGGAAREEVDAAKLMATKYLHETKAKEDATKLAKIELDTVEILLKLHTIRNPIPHGDSTVKTIVRRRGETVKRMEPIIQLYNVDNLLAEGMVDYEHQKHLKRDMPAMIEPAFPDPPLRVLYAHRQEVTSVAVSKDAADPRIVSASKDKTVCIWSRKQAAPLEVLFHPEWVNVVACPPRGSPRDYFLSGCADGSIRVWDFANLQKPVHVISDAHQDGVTALAFSPDGMWFASGGADNNIRLWSTETGKQQYSFDKQAEPHQGAITSLHFTPQTRLVSASRDNTIHVWKLHEKGAELELDAIAGRSGFVSQLGVSDDGRWMLFDQGDTLQVLSVADGRTMNALQKPSGATPFETFAIFSPDSSLLLTAGAAEGRLQLWKTPTPGVRGFEARQLFPKETSPATCAAFAPNAGREGLLAEDSFAVSGTKDGYVYLWQIPTAAEVDAQRIPNAHLTMIERALDAGVKQIRVGVELRNLSAQQRLIPGLPVTIVIDPRAK